VNLPRLTSSKLVTRWIFVTLAASIVAMLDGGWLASWASFSPQRICHGQIWRIVTWIFIENWPPSLLFTCVSLYKFGGELAVRWGDRRLRRFALQLIIIGGIAGTLAGFFSGTAWHMQRCGGWIVGDLVVIAWARQFPFDSIRLYNGLITLSGERLMYFTLAVTTIYAIGVGVLPMVPELFVAYATAFYPRAWLDRLGRR
jgi:membrane associated rhomboid family serine protease